MTHVFPTQAVSMVTAPRRGHVTVRRAGLESSVIRLRRRSLVSASEMVAVRAETDFSV